MQLLKQLLTLVRGKKELVQHEELTTSGWFYAIRIGTKNRTKLVKADKGSPMTMEQMIHRQVNKLKPQVGMRHPEKRRGRRALFQA